MKLKLLLLMLMAVFTICAQDKRDKLLERDHKDIIERLQLMDYMTDVTMKLKYHLKKDSSINFKQYFNDTILAKYPKPEAVYLYLDYKPGTFNTTPQEFIDKVSYKNSFSFYSIIVRYGYPSVNRLYKYGKTRIDSGASYLELASDEWKKKIYPLIEYENKQGNMAEPEYEFCKMMIRGAVSREEMDIFNEKMKKWGHKSIKA